MGCESYYFDTTPIKFSEQDDDIGCLCTFPDNDQTSTGERLDFGRVRSLAYLGAAVVLLQRHAIDHGYRSSGPIPRNTDRQNLTRCP